MEQPSTALKRRASILRDRMRVPDVDSSSSTKRDPSTTQPMTGTVVRLLVAYLLAIAIGGLWTAWTAWTALPSAMSDEQEWPDIPNGTVGENSTPVINGVRPSRLYLGSGVVTLRIFGQGFNDSSTVSLDGRPRRNARFIPPHQLCLDLSREEIGRVESIAVTVATDSMPSLPVRVPVESEAEITVLWRPFFALGVGWHLTLESRLILLVVTVGLLGGTLASFNSLSSYRGDGKLLMSWKLYYFVSPILGLGTSLLLYAVIRAGFLAGTNMQLGPTDTPWGLVAISGLAGLFYDKTLLKLRDVFMTLFAPRDTRGGKLEDKTEMEAGPAISTTALDSATRGAPYRARLEVSGGKPPYSWSVSPPLPGGLALDPMTGKISGTPTETCSLTQHTFSVSDMDRVLARVTLALEVRG